MDGEYVGVGLGTSVGDGVGVSVGGALGYGVGLKVGDGVGVGVKHFSPLFFFAKTLMHFFFGLHQYSPLLFRQPNLPVGCGDGTAVGDGVG